VVALEDLAEVTSVALAQVTWRTSATNTQALDDVISLAAAFTTTALIVHITGHTPCRITAPTES
jgi:hypothetical protein